MIFALGVFLALTVFTAFEILRNGKISPIPARPEAENSEEGFQKIMNSNIHEVLAGLEEGKSLTASDYETIERTCDYLDARYDCSDFRMQSLLRMLFNHRDKLELKSFERIKTSLLGSRFFMDQPGEDSLCLWSENHLLLFAAAEYLTGQLFEDEIFSNDGLSGKRHKEIAGERLDIWLEQRFKYGFIEWNSNTYYEEDIAPLCNLIDFCDDPLIVTRTKMILDLLLFDLAAQSHRGSFTSTSGRQYEMGKKSGSHSALRNVTRKIWNYETARKEAGLDVHFLYVKNYEIPEVIRKIGREDKAGTIKASTGLDLKELVKEFPEGQSLPRVMMQWAMEAFSNPEVIGPTLRYIHSNRMVSNEFMNDFKLINLSVLKYSGLLPLVSRILKPVTNGTPIQRANTYTYKTDDYMLATAQAYHPGDFGDQQHIWSATVSPDLCVFTTHPASSLSEEGALSASPGYWVGNGRNPHSVQNENINLSLYVIDGKKGFMEKALLKETHCYFPADKFDESELIGNTAFGRLGETMIAVRGGGILHPRGDELIQKGNRTFWVTELGSRKDESFEDFKDRILVNPLTFDDKSDTLTYASRGKKHALIYKGDFLINGIRQELNYKRFDSPYSSVERQSDVIEIRHGDDCLILDYKKGRRTFGIN